MPGALTSTSDKVRVNFVTDTFITGSGFRLEYFTNGEHGCHFCVASKLASVKFCYIFLASKVADCEVLIMVFVSSKLTSGGMSFFEFECQVNWPMIVDTLCYILLSLS